MELGKWAVVSTKLQKHISQKRYLPKILRIGLHKDFPLFVKSQIQQKTFRPLFVKLQGVC